jgi:hypothetical protein
MTEAMTERNTEIVQRHSAGESFGQLAKHYGICRERVAQIFYMSKRPKTEFRFNQSRHILLSWICGKSSIPQELICHYCNGEDVEALEQAGLAYWEDTPEGDMKLVPTDLGRELLRWRPR